MNDKHARICAGLDGLDGLAGIDDVARATGISNRDINNAIRTIAPEYVRIVGTKRRADRRDNPKLLALTRAGQAVADDYSGPLDAEARLHELLDELEALRARVERLEDADERIANRQRRLARAVFDIGD
jgi:hypothetical protein